MSIGIDLGTCRSLVAIARHDKIQVLQNERGLSSTPSYISYGHPEVVVGSIAQYELVKYADKVIYGVKRILGKEFDDPTVTEDIKNWTYNIINKNGLPYIKVNHNGKDLELLPQQVSSEVLKYLKKLAEVAIKDKVNNVVLTVPAHFGPTQIQATEEAARLAGINNLKILLEPIAAALTYSECPNINEDHKILIYDFGGGTFDVSVVGFKGKIIELIATSGDSHLGGEDITNILFNHFYDEYKAKRGGLEGNASAKSHIRKACENAKIDLSDRYDTLVDCSVFDMFGIDGNMKRAEFNNLIKAIIDRTISIVENMLNQKKINKNEIGAIILAGGSSRIPAVKEALETTFEGIPVCKTINPDEAIVYGAAFYANLIGKNDPNLPQIKDNIEEIVHPFSPYPENRNNSNSKLLHPIISSREREENKNCIAIGIDLGTSTSLAFYGKDGGSYAIPDVTGKNEIDSCVFYNDKDNRQVGMVAKTNALKKVKSFVYDIKRVIGRKMSDPILQNIIKEFNYTIIKDNSDNPIVSFEDNNPKFTKTPEEISSEILLELKKNIIRKFKDNKFKVVLTVPANFTDSQRRATQAAADLAGLNVLQLINEPTAAAIAYGLTNNFDDKENIIVVYDFGGGTFDVSIIRIKGKVIELLGSGGDDHLGGSDLTERIYNYFAKKYLEASGASRINEKGSHHLRKACESAKVSLSDANESEISWSLLENCHVDNIITRNLFNELTKDLFDRTITILDETMKNNNISKESINEIVLVGGSSKIPYVLTIIQNFLPGVKISKAINPIDAVAQGAAILADDLLRNGENAQIIETSVISSPPPSLLSSTQLLQPPPPPPLLPIPSIPESDGLLTQQQQPSSSSPSPSPPPSNLRINESFVIVEKTSHNYGLIVDDLKTHKRRIDVIIKKGSKIPCTEKAEYEIAPNYDKTKISVYEGENDEIISSNKIHQFIFSGITKTPEGTKIEVEYSINKNGILIVKGTDLSDPTNTKEVHVSLKK